MKPLPMNERGRPMRSRPEFETNVTIAWEGGRTNPIGLHARRSPTIMSARVTLTSQAL